MASSPHQPHRATRWRATSALALALLVTLTAMPPLAVVAVTAEDCAAYKGYTTARTSQRCFYSNACYDTVLCCPTDGEATQGNANECLDITTFSCAFDSACDAMNTSSPNYHNDGTEPEYDPSTLYVNVVESGAAVQCCTTAGEDPQPPPNRPGFEPSSSSDTTEDVALTLYDDITREASTEPTIATCTDPNACGPSLAFARVVRTLCPELPTFFNDEFLNANLFTMCCWYENAITLDGSRAPAQEPDWGCGAGILDLPPMATYHCNFNLRGTQYCCNGRADPPPPASSVATTTTQNMASLSRQTLVYTYGGSQCTDRLLEPGEGDGVAGVLFLHQRTTVLSVLVLVAALLTLA